MAERYLSISGKPGLFRLVSQGKNMLIVENVTTGKRQPAYNHDKIISLADVAMYTDGEDEPLYNVFQSISEKTGGQPVDYKSLSEAELREKFAEYLPNFDRERVYNNDIKKLFSWYNILVAKNVTNFKDDEIKEDEAAEKAEQEDAQNVK